MHLAVIGAWRGHGLAFVRQQRAEGAQATATARVDAGVCAPRGAGRKPPGRVGFDRLTQASALAW